MANTGDLVQLAGAACRWSTTQSTVSALFANSQVSGREGEAGSACLKEDIIRQESSLELYLVLPFYGDMVLLEAT